MKRILLAAVAASALSLPAAAMPVARVAFQSQAAVTLAQYVTTDGSAAPSFGYLTPNGGWNQFLGATCGSGCADPLGEMSAAQQNWASLQTMGDLQWLGSTYNGVIIDPSALLGAARVAGATELDAWLNTGTTGNAATDQLIATAVLGDTGYDVSAVTGYLNQGTQSTTATPTSTGSASFQNQLNTINNLGAGILTGGGGLNINSAAGTGTALCSPTIASAQNAQAQSFVNNMMKVVTGAGGVSTMSGQTVAAGGASGQGVFGSSCLSSLMSGSRDTLFKPPGLGSLVSQIGSMFGSGGASGGGSSGGGSSGCGNAPSPLTQAAQSNPTGIFYNGGGFFPALGFGAGEGTSTVYPIPAVAGGNRVQGGLSGMYAITSH